MPRGYFRYVAPLLLTVSAVVSSLFRGLSSLLSSCRTGVFLGSLTFCFGSISKVSSAVYFIVVCSNVFLLLRRLLFSSLYFHFHRVSLVVLWLVEFFVDLLDVFLHLPSCVCTFMFVVFPFSTLSLPFPYYVLPPPLFFLSNISFLLPFCLRGFSSVCRVLSV